LSFDYGAQHLFCFSARGDTFPVEEFRNQIQPYLAANLPAEDTDQLPWEGIGCWHPVFPARDDDVWALAPLGLKYIEKIIDSDLSPSLAVYPRLEEHPTLGAVPNGMSDDVSTQ
jgi:hypothetical protein